MKVGDLVRSQNDELHQKLGYGFVIEIVPNTTSVKIFWLRYKGRMNPRWVVTDFLEKVE